MELRSKIFLGGISIKLRYACPRMVGVQKRNVMHQYLNLKTTIIICIDCLKLEIEEKKLFIFSSCGKPKAALGPAESKRSHQSTSQTKCSASCSRDEFWPRPNPTWSSQGLIKGIFGVWPSKGVDRIILTKYIICSHFELKYQKRGNFLQKIV